MLEQKELRDEAQRFDQAAQDSQPGPGDTPETAIPLSAPPAISERIDGKFYNINGQLYRWSAAKQGWESVLMDNDGSAAGSPQYQQLQQRYGLDNNAYV